MLRTHTCGELKASDASKNVRLAGWVNAIRNLGNMVFIDLRDRYGLTQVKIDYALQPELEIIVKRLHNEWVIEVSGIVSLRPQEMINLKNSAGEIEVLASEIKVLGQSKILPFEINEEKVLEANEALRLKYRFIDLRRPKLQKMLKVKDDFITYIREYFHKLDFLEVQTPILANSSPEGARDFLVPSRLYPGKFYALPQAPQQFKQLLMVGGVDKYFQIAPCFRDEDPRMDRAYGEFYQLDMEMSFVDQEDIFEVMEPLMKDLTLKFSHKELANLLGDGRFARLSWREAMDVYGSDKPDLRFELPIQDVSAIAGNCGFSVFEDAVRDKGVVRALKIDGGAKFSRKDIDGYVELAKKKGGKGLAYLILKDDIVSGSFAKFINPEKLQKISVTVGANNGDIVFFAADTWRSACNILGAIRNEVAINLDLKDNSKAAWVWIVDFPMYDYSDIEDGRLDFAHNPFSMPQGGIEALEGKNPLDILAYQYDLVLNGFEVSSGAIRNHDPEIMYKAFSLAGYDRTEVESKFSAMINAFSYGAPPHGGNAPGIDRLLMVLNDWASIRDIYAFPKDGKGQDLMANSPSEVGPGQLSDLHISVDKR